MESKSSCTVSGVGTPRSKSSDSLFRAVTGPCTTGLAESEHDATDPATATEVAILNAFLRLGSTRQLLYLASIYLELLVNPAPTGS